MFAKKIIPKDRVIATVSLISYKVGCSEKNFKEVLCSEKWPAGIVVEEFMQKKLIRATSKTHSIVAFNVSSLPATPSDFLINGIPYELDLYPSPNTTFSHVSTASTIGSTSPTMVIQSSPTISDIVNGYNDTSHNTVTHSFQRKCDNYSLSIYYQNVRGL